MVNEWTRKDVPGAAQVLASWDMAPGDGYPPLASHTLDVVVAHLNAHHPKPTPGLLSNAADCVLDAEDRAKSAKSDADRLRRAHEIVEGERDLARDRCRELERELDVWKARAEAAEARSAGAVTRDDIEKAIRGKVWAANRDPNKAGFHRVHIAWATDSVWSLVSGADPAVHVVRESELPEVWRDNKHNLMGEFCRHWWTSDGDWAAHQDSDAREARALIPNYLRKIAGWEATARAIEAEAGQATDPVEGKARELWRVVHEGDGVEWHQAVSDVRDRYFRLARHVLGQEAGE